MTQSLWIAASRFFEKMIIKLINQKETHGYSGWSDPAIVATSLLVNKLHENITRRDWVDVANLAMILDYRKCKNEAGQDLNRHLNIKLQCPINGLCYSTLEECSDCDYCHH
jgi:hypothetical protein